MSNPLTVAPGPSTPAAPMKTVTVYSKQPCVQCDNTYRALDSAGIEYNVIDLSEDSTALQVVKELGYLQAPVVVAGKKHWSGFRPDLITELKN